jgi:hypothetical protein
VQFETGILESLFYHLLMRQVLKPNEVVAILNAAKTGLSENNSTTVSVQDAMGIISRLVTTYRSIEP